MARLNRKDAERLAQQVVKTYGADHKAEVFGHLGGCRYYVPENPLADGKTTDEPSCIVGQVAELWGNADLIALVKRHNGDYFDFENMPGLEAHVTPRAQAFLCAAQAKQDNGHSWGEALQAAKRVR